MHVHRKNAAVLWTGGKDSAMALLEAARRGYRVRCLATFAPPGANFLAHPLSIIRLQAQALGLRHHILTVTAPFEEAYEAALRWLQRNVDIDCVVTGDIAEFSGHPNWIRERSRAAGIDVCTPLWGRDRNTLLRQLIAEGLKAHISCVDTSSLDKEWVGRELDDRAIRELHRISVEARLDAAGENGEYHTVVLDAPCFSSQIVIRSHAVRTAASVAYMEPQRVGMVGHAR